MNIETLSQNRTTTRSKPIELELTKQLAEKLMDSPYPRDPIERIYWCKESIVRFGEQTDLLRRAA